MLIRKQALLVLALMASFPIASWAAPESTQPDKYSSNAVCPYGGPGMMGRGYGHGMMQGRFDSDDFHHRGHRMGYMHDTDSLKAQLDKIKDPKVKAKYIDMVKARIAFEQSQLESINAMLDSQK
ncbi:hypothetical protein AB3Y13_16030 [Vibrio alginolyticus]